MVLALNILEPNLKYSVLVDLSSTTQYGRAIVVMDKNFCTDSAGNKFTRTANSSFYMCHNYFIISIVASDMSFQGYSYYDLVDALLFIYQQFFSS
jgi:hypothetical protein